MSPTDLIKRSPIHKSESKYAVIIDAGSSGSRLFVYEWPDPVQYRLQQADNKTAQQSLPPLHLDPSWKKKTSPGISSYSNRIDKVWSGHLQELIKHAQSIIPAEDHFSTPIYFLATAGMRLLPEKDQTALLDKVCTSLKEHSNFYLPECESHVSVIDGETEGLYGWLALNYLLGPTESYSNPVGHSYGFMDMGGASAQIAFSPNKTETERHLDDLYDVHLRSLDGEDRGWKVFVSTWLGFGANEARKRLSEYLVLNQASLPGHDADKNNNHNTISDPCSPSGHSFNYYHGLNSNTTIVGAGNFDHCLNQLVPLLNKGLPCKDDPCLFNGIHVPAIDFNSDKLVGVSEYWYTANDIFDMGGKYDFTKFSAKAKDFCSLPWDQVVENSEKGLYKNMPKEYLSTACFKAAWVVNILHEGFGVPLTSNDQKVLLELNKRAELALESNILEDRNIHDFIDPFQSAVSIDGVELTWTLGKAMLYASSQVPPASSGMIEVGYMPAGIPDPKYVNGGETMPFTIPYHHTTFISSGHILFFVFIIIFWFAFAFFKSTLFGHGHYYTSRRMFAFSSILNKVRHLSYPVWSLFYRFGGNGKSYMELDRNDDSDRLLEEGLIESDLAMKSYPDSPSGSRTSFAPRRMKSSGNLGKSTSMLDLNNAPTRVSSRLSMRPEPMRPLSSFDIHDDGRDGRD